MKTLAWSVTVRHRFNRYLAALDGDGKESVHGGGLAISEHKMGLKDEGLGRIVRYAIGYTGCVEIDGGYHDALLVSFSKPTRAVFALYVLYESMGAGDGLCGATTDLQVRPSSSKSLNKRVFP